ncbi:hypothetical protein [Sanxia atyid shrimp virus 1]|uniref:hypothetical protein n=1 Tax=Sanxia atyid shrimp virus 1 TaxID=1923355 RepID=UPI00090A8CD3|nr:hypothetical protein [Sanxia atyid shrimp virus 1]APG77737.1 hypothetical protein [Sanxia atyid shrimp virus 1]
MSFLLYLANAAIALYSLDDRLASSEVYIAGYGSPASQHEFSHCFQDHPCSNLAKNCTHGHLLDRQFGGQAQCYNCMPQSIAQQIEHSKQLVSCRNIGGLARVAIFPNSSEPCEYSYSYACYQGIGVLFTDLFPNYFVPFVFTLVLLVVIFVGCFSCVFARCCCR